MALQEGIIFGIIAMLGWGFADFFVVKSLKKTNVIKTFLWSQLIGIVAFAVFFAFFFKMPDISMQWGGIFVLTSVLGFIAYLSFYKGLGTGKVSVVAPITACWAAITVILSIIFLKEQIVQLQLFGIILAISGAVLVSFKLHDLIKMKLRNFTIGAEYAALAAVAWGIQFVFIDMLVEEFGWFIPMFLIKIISLLFLIVYISAKKESVPFPRQAGALVIAIAALEVAAFLSYGFAISTQNTAITAPLISAAPTVTVILAFIFFKEKIELNQKIGMVAALSGIVLLSL